jgi:AraC family transcriptional regulator, transcriptional activator of the genes for pyochelin and ferripyochelin receptors
MTLPTLQIAYRELDAELLTVAVPEFKCDFAQRKAHHTDLGSFQERSFAVGEVRINEISAQFTRNCKISVNDQLLSHSLHLCLPLEGNVGGEFDDAEISARLRPKMHHYLFTPGQEYELMFDKDVKLAHVEFGIPYLNSLLCPAERWSNDLKEKLFKQEVVYSGGSLACKATNDIIQAILTCSLSGNLRRLFMEAKTLELVAIQLSHYRGMEGDNHIERLKKADRQLMEEVKAFLLLSFKDDHSLQSIASEFGINEFKLKKNFKLQFGHTIFDFLFNIKMDHAYQLLRDGGKFVNEVSREIGYKNPNHFTTAFTKKFGVSPSKLRS